MIFLRSQKSQKSQVSFFCWTRNQKYLKPKMWNENKTHGYFWNKKHWFSTGISKIIEPKQKYIENDNNKKCFLKTETVKIFVFWKITVSEHNCISHISEKWSDDLTPRCSYVWQTLWKRGLAYQILYAESFPTQTG